MKTETARERLTQQVAQFGPLCVGIDPHPELLSAWGLDTGVAGLREFSLTVAEACRGQVGIVKPQIAFFERFGATGYAVLEETLAQLRAADIFIVADAKRGDIGSTMKGYAQAWFNPESPLCADSLTVTPYLGFGALTPVLELAEEYARAVFVLAATSNPEARHVQGCTDAQGVSVAQHIVTETGQWNAEHAQGWAGVVLGATLPELPDIRQLQGPLLMPGVGAQGASFADIAKLTADTGALALPNVSRGILQHGPDSAALGAAITEQAAAAKEALGAH